jgi:hypothetical protein
MPVNNYGGDDFDLPRLPVQQKRQRSLPYSQGKRAFYGTTWAIWTAILVIGGFSTMSTGSVGGGLVLLLLGFLAATYDWRIWTWQARHLWVLLIF